MNNKNLIRYWFEFEDAPFDKYPPGISIGCGVAAFSYEDALYIIEEKVFKRAGMPAIKKIIENVDISSLDKGHVIPNMNEPVSRGIWFPLGYN